MFDVRSSVTNNVFRKDFQHPSGFFVNQTRNSLYSTTVGQPPNSGLSDSLDVISQHFPVPISTTFTQTFSVFTSTSHDAARLKTKR
jgi:hypothetical protein